MLRKGEKRNNKIRMDVVIQFNLEFQIHLLIRSWHHQIMLNNNPRKRKIIYISACQAKQLYYFVSS